MARQTPSAPKTCPAPARTQGVASARGARRSSRQGGAGTLRNVSKKSKVIKKPGKTLAKDEASGMREQMAR